MTEKKMGHHHRECPPDHEIHERWVRLVENGDAQEEAEHIVHYLRRLPGTYSGGDFIETLLDAIARADRANSAKLATGFPTYVALMRAVRHHPGTLQRLINAIRPTNKHTAGNPFGATSRRQR